MATSKRKTHEVELLFRIAGFCRAADMHDTAFGLESIGDPRLIPDLKYGRELRRKTRARIESFMASYATKSRKSS